MSNENYDAEVGQAIKTLSHLPPHILAQSVIEAWESYMSYEDQAYSQDLNEKSERQRPYEVIIEACFTVESSNSGIGRFLNMVFEELKKERFFSEAKG